MPTAIAIAAVAAIAVLLMTYGFAARQSKDAVQQRLEQLVVTPRTLEEMELHQPLFERLVRPIVQRLSRFASRGGQQGGLIARTDAKLERAGYPGGLRGAYWMGVKILAAIVLGAAVALILLATGKVQLSVIFGPAGAALGYMVPEFWLGSRSRKRSFAMVLQLPDARGYRDFNLELLKQTPDHWYVADDQVLEWWAQERSNPMNPPYPFWPN